MTKQVLFMLGICLLLISSPAKSNAQNELAATLEVLSPGVTVQRVNTSDPIAVSVEAIVGVGDVIRTDDTGQARITFFADGTDTELLPNTEYVIEAFTGDEENFSIAVQILAGETVQRLNRILDVNSSYEINTPGMALAARGTTFSIRVERGGRTGMLVSEGTVEAGAEADTADVSANFGIRSEADGLLSDVVPATTFEELDAALDGCSASAVIQGDVRFNVRLGPSLEAQRVGTVDPSMIDRFIGTVEDGEWYRIAFRGGFGWVQIGGADISDTCAGLRIFTADQFEDASAYAFIGDPIEIETEPTITPTEVPDDSDDGP
jgi:hypothetical protein